jgi:hypothetical protein
MTTELSAVADIENAFSLSLTVTHRTLANPSQDGDAKPPVRWNNQRIAGLPAEASLSNMALVVTPGISGSCLAA